MVSGRSAASVRSLRPSALAGAGPDVLMDAWCRELDAAGRAAATLRGHRHHIGAVIDQLATQRGCARSAFDLRMVTHDNLVQALSDYRHAPDSRYTAHTEAAPVQRSDYSLQRRGATIKLFFAWAHSHGHIPTDPAAGLTTPKLRTRLPRAFEVPDARLLFDAAALSQWPARDHALVAIALTAGPRLAEFVGMQVVDVVGRPPRHISVIGKGDKQRRVPLAPMASAALDTYLEERRDRLAAWGLQSPHLWLPVRLTSSKPAGPPQLRRAGIADTFNRLLTTAGIRLPGHRVHVLRGTAATALLRSGRSVREVQLLLGHADISTTARYLLVTDRDLEDAVAASPFAS